MIETQKFNLYRLNVSSFNIQVDKNNLIMSREHARLKKLMFAQLKKKMVILYRMQLDEPLVYKYLLYSELSRCVLEMHLSPKGHYLHATTLTKMPSFSKMHLIEFVS